MYMKFQLWEHVLYISALKRAMKLQFGIAAYTF